MKSPQIKLWHEAMEEEIQTMYERKVWTLTKLPEGTQPLGCRWVYTVKRNETGEIARYKARLVAQGYKQIKGESYDETFSPVVNFGAIRFFYAILVSCQGWTHFQCDIKCAYLYAPLTEKIYITQPPGFVISGKENFVCKLEKALYGLHQSGRVWFFELNKVLLDLGFEKLQWCNCVYIFKNSIVLLIYVDDIVIFGITKKYIDQAIVLLSQRFDMKLLGKTKKLLGVDFVENKNGISIHQSSYIEEVCDRFKKFKFPISSLPICKGVVYSKTQCPQSSSDSEEMLNFPYRSVLGCLSFIANRTRPDISYAVNIFSQFQSNPGMIHWDGLLKLLGYVSYTKEHRLNLSCSKIDLIAFSDADFAANRDDRTSMGGQILFIEKAPIAWRTFKEKCVSLSTMESEFIAMTETAKELLWFDRILTESFNRKIFDGHKVKSCLYVDNMAALDFVKSPIENYRTKHIDIKLFFIRDLIYKDTFQVKHIKSKENLSDIFTKPLTKYDLNRFKEAVFRD